MSDAIKDGLSERTSAKDNNAAHDRKEPSYVPPSPTKEKATQGGTSFTIK